MLAINFNNPDKGKVARNLIVALNDELKTLIKYWTDDQKRSSLEEGEKKKSEHVV